MRTIIAGNWKMHKDKAGVADLITRLVAGVRSSPTRVEVVIAPAFPFLGMAVSMSFGEGLHVAAQNCHEEPDGAFTGEVSAPMLKSVGISHCIVGHSERRQFFGETDEAVGRKITALDRVGITPVLCCGEQREERENGRHFDVVATQLHTALAGQDPKVFARTVIAYEPVWAIGTGLTASAGQAQEMHAFIRSELVKIAGEGAHEMPILYGGSCKPDNAAEILAGPDVNGGLIGGASLDPASFLEIVRIADAPMP
ncbi:MAG: triose-phosphate isomerase [Flavobacteriales bacterium]|nr:triose-phosphate isomerase [Flavobacteriales bacterium]MCB9193909.1 triose-phosphate isomerase [Flavobacteriales bacterium]